MRKILLMSRELTSAQKMLESAVNARLRAQDERDLLMQAEAIDCGDRLLIEIGLAGLRAAAMADRMGGGRLFRARQEQTA